MDTAMDASMDTYPVKVESFEYFWGNEMDTAVDTPMNIPMDTDTSKLQNF
jgi:hypothetical protein